MASTTTEKVKKWVRTRMGSAPPVTRFELQHTKTEEAPSVVETWEIGANDSRSEEACDKLSAAMVESSEDHATAYGKTQTYCLVAFAGRSGIAELPFRLKGTATETTGAESEPPTNAGVLAQFMRHNEAMMRTMLGMTESSMANMLAMHDSAIRPIQNENMALRGRVSELEDNGIQSFRLLQELSSEVQDRELARDKHTKDQARKDKALKKGVELLTSAVGGGKAAMMKRQLAAFGESLTPEELSGVVAALGPKAAPVMKMLSEAMKPEDEEEEEDIPSPTVVVTPKH